MKTLTPYLLALSLIIVSCERVDPIPTSTTPIPQEKTSPNRVELCQNGHTISVSNLKAGASLVNNAGAQISPCNDPFTVDDFYSYANVMAVEQIDSDPLVTKYFADASQDIVDEFSDIGIIKYKLQCR